MSKGISIEGVETPVYPQSDDPMAAAYGAILSRASWLFSMGDLYSLQVAQNDLLALDRPVLRVGTERIYLRSSPPYGRYQSYSKKSASAGKSGYKDVSYVFLGVGGDLL